MKKLSLTLACVALHGNALDLYEQAQQFQKAEEHTHAIECYKKILQKDVLNASALFSLGSCYLAIGDIEQAIKAYDTILTIHPNIIPALYNKAYTLKTAGLLDQAISLYKKIIDMDEAYDPAQLSLGFAYLVNGDFERGWKQHERYLKKSGKNGDSLRALLHTHNVAGKTILLSPEGGLGDSLQFIRYAQRLHEMGATVIVCAQKPLIPLLSLCPYINSVISPDTPLPEHHVRATLMSLPAIFEDNEDTFPREIPYLNTNAQLVEQWKNYFSQDTNYKIGICWQADVQNDVSRLPIARRGCLLKYFTPLQNVSAISLYSLQKFDGVEQIATMPANFPLHIFDQFDEQSGPFMDSAAIIKNLDLVITVDTATAHLAGALGCKVWLLLPYATDWRWINNRTDSPWYPNMKIFKQKTPFDWESVMQEVVRELGLVVNKKQ